MNRYAGVLAVAASIVLLSGCTSTSTQETIVVSTTPGQTASSTPITGGTITNGDSTIELGDSTAEVTHSDVTPGPDTFVAQVRNQLGQEATVVAASDDALVAAGQSVCTQIADGVDDEDVKVTVGGTKLSFGPSVAMTVLAQTFLCA